MQPVQAVQEAPAPYHKAPSPSMEGQGLLARTTSPPFEAAPASARPSPEEQSPFQPEEGGGDGTTREQTDAGLLTPAMILGGDQVPMLGAKAKGGTCLQPYCPIVCG